MMRLLSLKRLFLINKSDGLYMNKILQIFFTQLMFAGKKFVVEKIVYFLVLLGNFFSCVNFRFFLYEVVQLLRMPVKFGDSKSKEITVKIPFLVCWIAATKAVLRILGRVKVSSSNFRNVYFNLVAEILKSLLFRGNAYKTVLLHNVFLFNNKRRIHYRW